MKDQIYEGDIPGEFNVENIKYSLRTENENIFCDYDSAIASTPIIQDNPLSADYEQGEDAHPLTVSASVNDMGKISYMWYSNSIESVEGGTFVGEGPLFVPSTSTIGTTYYFAVATNNNEEATLNKTASSISRIAKITVSPCFVTGVRINTDKLVVKEGEEKTLQVTLSPENASNKTLVWVSSDESVATVDLNGKITGVNKGTTTITVTTIDGGFTDTCTITVVCPHENKNSIEEKSSDCKIAGWDAYME